MMYVVVMLMVLGQLGKVGDRNDVKLHLTDYCCLVADPREIHHETIK